MPGSADVLEADFDTNNKFSYILLKELAAKVPGIPLEVCYRVAANNRQGRRVFVIVTLPNSKAVTR